MVRRRSALDPLVVLVVAAAVPAFGLWRLASWADARADDGAAQVVQEPAVQEPVAAIGPAMPTPLLSFRRTADELSDRLNLGAFRSSVQPLLDRVGERSCVAVATGGVIVGERHIDRAVLPASSLKIVVAAVALDVLGAQHRYVTRVVGPPVVDGVVTGDVHLVGGGDPVLSSDWYPDSGLDRFPVFNTTSLDDLARRVAAAGVREIRGSVIGDGSRYDDEFYVGSWGGGVAGVEAGPYDALLVNDARVLGDDQRGSDPASAAAREFVRLLGEVGVAVSGGAGSGPAPVTAVEFARIESAALPAVIEEMLTTSDNNTAELVVKEIGVAVAGVGTRQAGLDAIVARLSSWGIDTAGLVLGDGSGLSLDNRLTCGQLLGVLQRPDIGPTISAALPVAGRTGTLSEVFVDSEVAGRLRGKTGTLNNPPFDQDPPAVKALAGYLPVEGDDPIEYVLVLNGPTISDQREYREIWAELVAALVSYPAVATPTQLGPVR